MLSVLDVDVVVIGGGVSKMGHVLFDTLPRGNGERMVPKTAKNTPIVPAEIGEMSASSEL